MSDTVTVTFPRAEYDALTGVLRDELPELFRIMEHIGGPILLQRDLKAAWETLEAAGNRPRLAS